MKLRRQTEKKQKAPKEPKASSIRSAGKKQKFIFFIGDEGAILVLLEGKTVSRRLFSPSADPESIGNFRQLITSVPRAPVYALIDMIDQSYMKQSLPPVTKLSVQKLIRRRLERDFGPEDITGALSLGRETGGRKDWNYMLISLAGSPQLMQWLDFILELNNPFEGLYLVPVEAASFIQTLSKQHPFAEPGAWQLLVSHHKVGGFRQVILKDGKLTFTRLAQPIGDTSPEVVAGNVEQEIANTIEYLKRLSFTEDQGLDCFVIVSADIKKYIESTKIKARNVTLLTPFEVNELMGLDKAALPEDHYADVVFSASFGLARKKILALHSKYSQQLMKLRKLKTNIMLFSVLLLLGLGGYDALGLSDLVPQMEEMDSLESQIARLSAESADSTALMKNLPPDIDRMEDLVAINGIFSENKDSAISFIRTFKAAAQGEVVITKFSWKNNSTLEKRFNKEPASFSVSADVQFLKSTGSIDEFALRAKNFFNRVRTAYPEFKMTTSKLPGIIDQGQSFQAQFNGTEGNQAMLSGDPIIVTLTFNTLTPEELAAIAAAQPVVAAPQ